MIQMKNAGCKQIVLYLALNRVDEYVWTGKSQAVFLFSPAVGVGFHIVHLFKIIPALFFGGRYVLYTDAEVYEGYADP